MSNFNLKRSSLLILALTFFTLTSTFAAGFNICKGGKAAQIYLSADEPMPLKIAAEALQSDIEMVTGVRPEIINDKSKLAGEVIVLSTAKNNRLVDGKSLDGLYQSYLMREVAAPFEGVSNALVVVGSDALGAVYGVYNISEKIGVSPLYWYCDITPLHKSQVVIEECNVEPHQPSVKYRGIFVNDEEATILWSQYHSQSGEQGITPETYKHIYEFILRIGANTIWPSMMEEGAFFFEAKDENGVALNPKNATDYGIYVGTSHCENMARNNNAEWYEWAAKNSELFSDDLHEFDYTVNPDAIEAYWRERLVESRDFNIIYTMGIRAVHDSEFKHRKLENPTLENKVKLIQKVIDRQREIIAEVCGSADAVPQIFTPYEEMAEFYNGEKKDGSEKCKGLEIPDDVIIISTDDNYGFLRQLPTEREVERKGGSGIYYHLAYQGNPAPYDWLTTMPFKLMQQELAKLDRVGATSFWMVNVGDIKPSEMALKYFMDIATDLDKYLEMNPRDYVTELAQELFNMNKKQALQLSNLYTRFCLSANAQKPEFMSAYWVVEFDKPHWTKYYYYSTADFNDEAERMILEFKDIESEAKQIYDALPKSRKDAFWHLVYYPMRSTMLMAQKSYYYYKNKIYAKQGRFASVNGYKNLSLEAAQKIDDDLHYYNKELAGGKWDGIMDPYATYNIFERVVDDANIPKDLIYKERFVEQGVDGIGSVCEGQITGEESVSLLFSSLEQSCRFIDIFNRGAEPQPWSVECSAPWVVVSELSGSVEADKRLWVSINWKRLPAGENKAQIVVKGRDGEVKQYPVVATKITEKIKRQSYVEGAGFVSIEAENFSNMVAGGDGSKWIKVDDLTLSGSSMVVEAKEGKVENPSHGAVLEYQIYFTSTGTFDAVIYRIPTLNEGKGRSCQFGVALNDEKPQVVDGIRRKDHGIHRTLGNGSKLYCGWRINSFMQLERIPVTIKVTEAGYNTLKIYQMDNGIGIDRIVIPTTEQSAVVQWRSLIGAPESYNTVDRNYEPQAIHPEVNFTKEQIEVKQYPKLEPLMYGKFLFAKQGIPEYWGFTTMTTHNIYDKNTNLYGWAAEDIDKLSTRHIVGSRSVPYYRLFSHRANSPATFCATVREGNYEVLVFTGNITEYYSGKRGDEYDLSVKANGVEVISNDFVESDKPYIGRFDVKVGKDNKFELEFSGQDQWGVSVVEIYRK